MSTSPSTRDRLAFAQVGDHQCLGDDVGGEHEGRDAGEHAIRRRPGARGASGPWPRRRLARVAQRRSSRCLHSTHRVARGNACSRAFPIGLPHDSHTPYVPASIRASARSVCVEQFARVVGERELVLPLVQLAARVGLVVAGLGRPCPRGARRSATRPDRSPRAAPPPRPPVRRGPRQARSSVHSSSPGRTGRRRRLSATRAVIDCFTTFADHDSDSDRIRLG